MRVRTPEPTQERLRFIFEDIGNTIKYKVSGKGRVFGREVRCIDGRGYLTVKVDGRNINVHRALWIMRNGPIPEGMQVDHIDGDQLNNLPENLRLALPAENNWNRRINRNNSSGHKGVCWNKSVGKWQAQHMHNLRTVHVGLFDTPDEAARALSISRELLHGEFACDG